MEAKTAGISDLARDKLEMSEASSVLALTVLFAEIPETWLRLSGFCSPISSARIRMNTFASLSGHLSSL